jgi:site-specific recombinase XerD
MYASVPVLHGCARPAALHMPRRARSGGAANLWQEHGVVFAQENGRPVDPRADWQEWSDILAGAGIPHAGTHTMRHSAATIALDQGVALAVVQEMLGHSDIRVTRGYTHVSSLLAQARRPGAAGPVRRNCYENCYEEP